MYKNIKAISKRLLACAAVATLLIGCSGQEHLSDGESFKVIDHTDVIDHRKGSPGEQLATLKITSELPVFENYYIAPGDTLDVVFHLERHLKERYPITLYHTVQVRFVSLPKLDQLQDVLPDGTISLPYLGAYKVIGKTTEELRQELQKAYSSILRNPEIYVSIKNFNTRVEQLRRDLQTSARGLSKLIKVRPDGYVTFPLLGDYYVAHKTIQEVFEQLNSDYKEYMPGLKLDLFMHDQTGTNVYVLGEVAKPGSYKLSRPISVLQAISRAGGYTRQGETSTVIVFRRDGDRLNAHRFDLKDMSKYGAQAANFYLQPEDILLVPRNKISSVAQLMREIADIAFFRGVGIGVGYDIKH